MPRTLEKKKMGIVTGPPVLMTTSGLSLSKMPRVLGVFHIRYPTVYTVLKTEGNLVGSMKLLKLGTEWTLAISLACLVISVLNVTKKKS
jgi:hypothetical protein